MLVECVKQPNHNGFQIHTGQDIHVPNIPIVGVVYEVVAIVNYYNYDYYRLAEFDFGLCWPHHCFREVEEVDISDALVMEEPLHV